jgi:thioredoxin 1
MDNGVYHFSDTDFETQVLESKTPVLVDFWAEWCGPCHIVGPTVEALAKEYQGKIKVGKLNVDENQVTPGKYGIRGIPSLLLFKGGQVVDNIIGAAPKQQIANMLDKHLPETK